MIRKKGIGLIFICVLLIAAGFLVIYFAINQRTGDRDAMESVGNEAQQTDDRDVMESVGNDARQTDESGAMKQIGNGIQRHGALRVEGTQLVNQSGEALQLRGMSSHGLQWYPEYTNYRALITTKEYGANLFRAAMYADSSLNGYSQDEEWAAYNKRMLYNTIENALAADMYVIADWHLLEDENPLFLINKAIPFFDELSQYYADEPGVIYEICNEPNGSATWEDVKAYADKVIPVIRKNAPDAIIIVGTPEYSGALQDAMAAPLLYDNIMYSYHYYSGLSGSSFYASLDTAKAYGLPVFISEWGICADPSTGQMDYENAKAFIAYMKQNQLSWVNWSLSNKAEDYSAIRPEVTKISGWTEEDLTEGGRLIFTALGG